MRGGARARSGPAPDPNALRRDRDEDDWVVLPADGREGDPPVWPLPTSTARERSLWAELWAKPQAVMWERLGQELEVALFVRRLVESEKRNSPVSLSTLVLRLAESLGLSTPGMLRNRWRIARPAPPPARVAADTSGASARERLTVVSGGGGS